MNGNLVTVDNYVAGKFVPPFSRNYLDVVDPADFHTIGKVAISSTEDVNVAVSAAEEALPSWSRQTIKARAAMVRGGVRMNSDCHFILNISIFCFSAKNR